MIGELITKVFDERNASHARHWTTDSYAQHQALGEFYDELITLIDKFVEAQIGTFGKIEEIPNNDPHIEKLIRENLSWINDNRSELSSNVPALENILDELAGLHMSTLFKLENLR